MSATHTVTADFGRDGWPIYTFNCHAPAESPCHAVYDCGCDDGWADETVVDGVPSHRPMYDDEGTRHAGHLNTQACNLRDWFENSDEVLRGAYTFPVTPDWQGDHVLFHAVDEHPRPQVETFDLDTKENDR
ncbi:hypothetical protein [Cellulomonas sp. KH9]|uniref:hypothetical protein n=1 Tax=Cellulomonas sp. KH9 TaxID=1855324 RepID=UPI0008E08186|nr:hypothetical protein [Cellulomonas sp. KH9]SFK31786.1 hypothetical protein SAMN05216467_2860 [Cellulomonas sp. KH9]